MARKREYIIEDVEFKGKAYKRKDRVVLNHKNCGIITLPIWMIGKKFNVILEPVEKSNEEKEGTITQEDN